MEEPKTPGNSIELMQLHDQLGLHEWKTVNGTDSDNARHCWCGRLQKCGSYGYSKWYNATLYGEECVSEERVKAYAKS